MQLSSSAFATDARIPRRHTCDGENLSPPLAWHGVPAGTRSFALFCDDPDAPRGTWHHWALFDIPAATMALPEGIGQQPGGGMCHAENDFGRTGYGGPCPPHGHGPHHYRFRLVALDVERLGLDGVAACRDVERATRKHVLAEAVLVGVYER